MAYRLCRRAARDRSASALALAAAAFVGRERFVERPHIFSLLGEVAMLVARSTRWRPSAARARARRGGRAVAAVVLWANLHAGAFVAPMLLSLRAPRGRALERHGGRGGGSRSPRRARRPPCWPRRSASGLVRYLRLHLTLPALHPVDEFRAAELALRSRR